LAASLVFLSATSWASVTTCDEIKGKIETKLAGKGVTAYTLEIAAKGTETKNRIVAQCNGGSKIIIYKRASKKKDAEKKAAE